MLYRHDNDDRISNIATKGGVVLLYVKDSLHVYANRLDSGVWSLDICVRNTIDSSGYAAGTIAVNVTWMKRGFNHSMLVKRIRIAACTHLSSTVSQ